MVLLSIITAMLFGIIFGIGLSVFTINYIIRQEEEVENRIKDAEGIQGSSEGNRLD